MNIGTTLFSQVMNFLPRYDFRQCVKRYRGNYKAKKFSCWNQYLCMTFAQLTYRESLRDIETCLRTMKSKLHNAGMQGGVARNTLANANSKRSWKIYADFAQILIKRARKLYAKEDFGLELEQVTYALDSTTIDLCLSLFPWATFRQGKSAVKVHTLLDLRGNIPTTIFIKEGNINDINILDELTLEPLAIYIMDRGYLDFARLYSIHTAPAFFVIRAKKRLYFKRLYSQPIDKSTGVRFDQLGVLTNYYSKRKYPEKIRRIGYFDRATKKRFVFLTNNLKLPAKTIADLYKSRWQVELFFKWLKQHLRIKAFYGTSENAVKTQIWIAISVYVFIAIIRKELKLKHSLYTILQILSVALFEKIPILQAFSDDSYTTKDPHCWEQLDLLGRSLGQ